MNITKRVYAGQVLAGPLLQNAAQMAMLIDKEYSGFIAMFALLYAAARAEVSLRIKGSATSVEHRALAHKLLDMVLDEEERRSVVLG